MRLPRRSFNGLLLSLGLAPSAFAQDDAALTYYREAKINWRQSEGQSLTIGSP